MKLHLLVVMTVFLCSSVTQNVVAQPSGKKKEKDPFRYEVIFNGQVVGTATFTEKVLQFASDDKELRQVVEEEVIFSGSRYIFQYVRQGGEVNGFSIRKFARRTGEFISGDSYALRIDTDGVHRSFYKEDGVTIMREWTVSEPTMTANARDLMRYIDNFWGVYYRPIFAGTWFKRKQKELPSLGYDLLNAERI
jgi:hypothetical protein